MSLPAIKFRQQYINPLDKLILYVLTLHSNGIQLNKLFESVCAHGGQCDFNRFFAAVGFLVKRDYAHAFCSDAGVLYLLSTDDGNKYYDYLYELASRKEGVNA